MLPILYLTIPNSISGSYSVHRHAYLSSTHVYGLSLTHRKAYAHLWINTQSCIPSPSASANSSMCFICKAGLGFLSPFTLFWEWTSSPLLQVPYIHRLRRHFPTLMGTSSAALAFLPACFPTHLPCCFFSVLWNHISPKCWKLWYWEWMIERLRAAVLIGWTIVFFPP